MLSSATIIAAILGVLLPKMAEIPAGSFYMGAEGVTADYNPDEAPIHKVEISSAFRMSVFEITNAEYECYDPSHRKLRGLYGFSSKDDEAVVYVSWEDASAYCRWLSKKTGRTYRLPTEAEWEYACKAGTLTTYYWGGKFKKELSKNNVQGAEEKRLFEPIDLASLKVLPNLWGLYDMSGNVEEWCLDWYGPYVEGPQCDPVGPDSGDFKVTRGGSHTTSPTYLRSTNRSAMPPEDRSFAVGFRIVQADYPSTSAYPEISREEEGVRQDPFAWKPADDAFFIAPSIYVKAPESGTRMFKHNHEPALCWCPNGDLLAIWFSTDSEFGREMIILSSRLKAGENEWTAPREFFKVPDRNMTGLSLFYDEKSGEIIHLSGYDALGWWRNEAVIMRRSSDNGATWTRPVIVMPDHCPGHQLVAGMSRTSDGRLLQVCDAGPGGEDGSVLHISSDNGQSWVQCKSPIAGIHAGCVSLKDGSFLAFGRGNSVTDDEGINKMPFSISRNNGKSWSVAASCFPPIRGGQRLALLRLLEGPLLMISFDNEGSPSRGMFASLSYDEGKNWTSGKLLTDGVERCLDGGAWTGVFVMDASHAEPKGYLAATQTPDGTIHLISSKNYYKFNLKWLEKQ